jgi:hypothetical protein
MDLNTDKFITPGLIEGVQGQAIIYLFFSQMLKILSAVHALFE